MFYIYNYSKKVTNAVYVPYDNAVAISLKYKRILRRYNVDGNKVSQHNKSCFLYGIRKRPLSYIENRKIQRDNLPSRKLSKELDVYQELYS